MDAEQTAEREKTSTRLVMDAEVYRRVKHAAVDAMTSANAWIREAIAERLDGVPGEDGKARLCGAWDALNEEAREHLLWVAESAATDAKNRRPRDMG